MQILLGEDVSATTGAFSPADGLWSTEGAVEVIELFGVMARLGVLLRQLLVVVARV
jgi:hypothetical protein